MKKYLYLSLTPEALIASMLPPEEFGHYMAVGTKKKTRGQVIFFEVDINLQSNHFPLEQIEKRCVPHSDGTPKRSVYLSIYRVLEHVPLECLKSLYLVTDDGVVLKLGKSEYQRKDENGLHLYQQIAPVTPRIASSLDPSGFMKFVTNTNQPVSVPRLVFVELILDNFATDPESASINNIPYKNIDHLRDCLIGLKESKDKQTKTVIRFFKGEILYRTCKNGFFIGDQNTILYYPFPSVEDLEGKHYKWWRSALTLGFN